MRALVVISAVAGLLSLWRLHAGRWARARVGAVIAVAAIVVGWGVAQYPDLLVDEMTLDEPPAPARRVVGLIIVFGLATRSTAVPGAAVVVLARRRPPCRLGAGSSTIESARAEPLRQRLVADSV